MTRFVTLLQCVKTDAQNTERCKGTTQISGCENGSATREVNCEKVMREPEKNDAN